jgi:beta-N-acetylhexosaminidase
MKHPKNYSFSKNLILGISGSSLTAEEKHWFRQNETFSIILYQRNIVDPDQLASLIQDIQSIHTENHGRPTLLSIDMEGGPLHELPPHQFRYFPSGPELLANQPEETSLYRAGYELGTYLRELGFHINYAPVLDVLTHPQNELFRNRSWGNKPQDIIRYTQPYIRGMQDAGILAVAKHFPGHGHTQVDSHHTLPTDLRSVPEIESIDLPPFIAAYAAGVRLFMTAHVLYPALDPKLPATLSPTILTHWAQNKWQLPGFFIADDLDMGALRHFGNSEDILRKSVEAGGHFFMYCHRTTPPWTELEFMNQFLNNRAQNYILNLQQAYEEMTSLLFASRGKVPQRYQWKPSQ